MATESDVTRAIAASFDESDRPGIRAALSLYDDREAPRVRLAILALAEGDPGQVHALVKAALQDYRDPLYWAEYPEESSGGRVTRSEMAARYLRMGVPVPEDLRSSP